MPTFNTYASLTAADTADVLAIWDTSAGTLTNITVGQLFASPGPIGSTTPSTGAFTQLDVSGALSTSSSVTSTQGSDSLNWKLDRGLGRTLILKPSDASQNFAGSIVGAGGLTLNGGSGGIGIGSYQTKLFEDAANTLAMRNGTNAQLFNIYKTYTDVSNYERLQIGFTGSEFQITSQKGGTGVSRDLFLKSVGNLYFSAGGGNAQWKVDSANGDLLAITHNTRDIGSSSNAPRDIYAGRTVNAALNLSAGNGVYATNMNAGFDAPASGVVRLLNAAGTDFNRLQFGGTGTTKPALQVVGTGLRVCLADASADAPLSTGDLTIGAGTPIKKVLSAVASVTLNSGGTPSANTSITVTGAAVGDVVAISLPVGWVSPNYIWTAAVNSADTVIIQVSTIDGSGFSGTASIRATVIKH